MSVASALENARTKVASAYSAVSTKGGTLPSTQNLSNLPTAINSIPSGGTPDLYGKKVIINSNGKMTWDTSYTTFTIPSNCTELDIGMYYNAFNQNYGITTADMSSVTTVANQSCASMFSNAHNLTTLDLSGIQSVQQQNSFNQMCFNCTTLTSVDLSSLSSVAGVSAFASAFYGCKGLTSINLSSLTAITGALCFSSTFQNCTNLTTVTIGGTTPINFGTLKTQFNNMFSGCTQNITLNIATDQATLSTFNGYPKFGATGNVTINYTAVTE